MAPVSTMPRNAKSYMIHGCAEKLCGKNQCHLFYFMFVEIQHVSTCAIAIGGESRSHRTICHIRKMAKVRVSFHTWHAVMPR